MADIFLSYARPNVNQAKRIAATLGKLGYSVWFDQQLPAHRPYADVISSELDAATAVLVLWSMEAAGSQWVRSEASRARATGRLVQARLDNARLPMPFDQIQCADLRRWTGQGGHTGWISVVSSIAALLERDPPTATARTIARRPLLIGGGALALAGLGFAGWRVAQPAPSPHAKLLLEKGLAALQSNDALEVEEPGSTAQAIALLNDAAEADPRSAMAWGGLAMAYAVAKRTATPPDRPGLDARSRSAATRALAIDENDTRAVAALRLLAPLYRHWQAAEQANRAALKRQPRMPILFFLMSDMLGSVGRWREATRFSSRLDRSRFLIAGADRKVIVNLWATGDLQGADEAIRIAAEHWPQHPQIWRTRIAYLLYSGRPSEALALIDNIAERPLGTPESVIAAMRETGEAIRRGAENESPIAAKLAYLRETPAVALQVAQACVAVGATEPALAILRGYFFAEAPWEALAPRGGDADRLTGPLFLPPMRGLWSDPRFNRILEQIGLEAYWRASGTAPDYRRTS